MPLFKIDPFSGEIPDFKNSGNSLSVERIKLWDNIVSVICVIYIQKYMQFFSDFFAYGISQNWDKYLFLKGKKGLFFEITCQRFIISNTVNANKYLLEKSNRKIQRQYLKWIQKRDRVGSIENIPLFPSKKLLSASNNYKFEPVQLGISFRIGMACPFDESVN